MSWVSNLYETYNKNTHRIGDFNEKDPLLPAFHTSISAHIDITINMEGNFLRADVIPKDNSKTIIPCTEESSGRSGKKPVNHPLSDKLQYISGDFVKNGGKVTSGFKDPTVPSTLYKTSLQEWVESEYSDSKLRSVFNYIQKDCVIHDLVKANILFLDNNNKILETWPKGKVQDKPEIFKVLKNQMEAVVRWSVQMPGNPILSLHKDKQIWESWIAFTKSRAKKEQLCFITGIKQQLAEQHPKKILPRAANAKLISSNDEKNFTFRGRFTDSQQACSIGADASQKLHNCLSWLIKRQGYVPNKQTNVFVAWAISGAKIPDPMKNSLALFVGEEELIDPDYIYSGDVGQAYGRSLTKKIKGYRIKLTPSDHIVILGLDSASTGRAAITYYQELSGSTFLSRIEQWHSKFAWLQNLGIDSETGKIIRFIGAPSPAEIAEIVCGKELGKNNKSSQKVIRSIIETIIPCIISSRRLSNHIVEACIRNASTRLSKVKRKYMNKEYEDQWEKTLGIACAVFKGTHSERGYKMSLETDRTTRDYLYGRLLAIAEHIERIALAIADEKRDTTAAKLMQRFADHPYSTWLNIEKALCPYQTRLQSKRLGFLNKMKKIMDEIYCLFQRDEFIDDSRLSGEFLLGYHCQRQALRGQEVTSTENNK